MWVERTPSNKSARCKVCSVVLDISTMGAAALNSHTRGAKHKQKVDALSNNNIANFLSAQPTSATESSAPPPGPPQNVQSQQHPSSEHDPTPAEPTRTVNNYFERKVFMKSELLWVLNCVDKNLSFSSSSHSGSLFKRMFPDSNIAGGFSCGETKAQYLVNHAWAPYVSKLLHQKINSQKAGFVILFDESLNSVVQKKQLDFHIRLWHNGLVHTYYLTSLFLGKAAAVDLHNSFLKLDIDLKGMVSVSMDGPNVNLATHKLLEDYMQDTYGHGLLNIGSCSLHQVHNAVKAAFEKGCDWNIGKFLRALYLLFHDVPARRAEYESVNKNVAYPLNYCHHRWLENVKPAKRAAEIIPQLKSYIAAVAAKKVTKPSCASYDYVILFLKDPLARAKLLFFVSMCHPIEKYLTNFQTDKPMAPKIQSEITSMLNQLVKRFVKRSEYKEKNVQDVNINSLSNHKAHSDIDVGYACGEEMKKVKVSELVKLSFYSDVKKALICFIERIKKKSPLLYKLTHHLQCLNPSLIAKQPDECVQAFKGALSCLVTLNLFPEDSCDNAISQYSEFMDSDQPTFSWEDNRIDAFFVDVMQAKYPIAWKAISMLLMLSHGQATVERGFSINKEILTANLSEETLTNRRLVKDFIRTVGERVDAIEIPDSVVTLGLQAKKMYETALEQKRKQVKIDEKSRKRNAVEEDIDALKTRKKKVMDEKQFLLAQSFKESDRAEHTGSMAFVTKANAMRRGAEDKEKQITEIVEEIKKKQKLLDMII